MFDYLSRIYDCGKDNEDKEHLLLHCPMSGTFRQDLFGGSDLDVSVNEIIIKKTIRLIDKTKRMMTNNQQLKSSKLCRMPLVYCILSFVICNCCIQN